MTRSGPLSGVRVLELGGVGPVPFCGMHFADLGADVIRIERPLGNDPLSRSRRELNLVSRGKRTIAMDFRGEEGKAVALDLIVRSDVVMEGFRPGVLERLGLGPEDCMRRNPAIVYGRMTGWGAGGPMSNAAAHDINYLGIAGLLATIGTSDQPLPPLNIVGDFGGALYLVTGLLAALTHARATGQGQVVEASILGGTVALMAQLFAIKDHGDWLMRRQSNWMDGGAPFYRTYRTADGGFMAVGAIEPQFYKALLGLLELDGAIEPSRQMDRASWPDTARRFADAFAAKSRAEWTALAGRVDACCTPVLDMDEARADPHATAAGMFVTVSDKVEPAPQPVFSLTVPAAPQPSGPLGGAAEAILREIGRDGAAIEALFKSGAVSRPQPVPALDVI
ncbi:CaiB/BaiF CoA transferase family protein [Rhizorhabdus wittichii]|uniref:CaiB/BaiF CoA transferase family protein n=1 Tax=Rhizorhabdus wittichii TaxID=160791 RepID=UPI000C1FBA7D|nr:CaiB/BaiF CoA-transferase family protein [Rhizorhabdus wittichii]